jgi:hypothetical protein
MLTEHERARLQAQPIAARDQCEECGRAGSAPMPYAHLPVGTGARAVCAPCCLILRVTWGALVVRMSRYLRRIGATL